MDSLKLAEKALRLKRAWLCASVITGHATMYQAEECFIHNYGFWPKSKLKVQIRDLEQDFCDVAGVLFLNWNKRMLGPATKWLADRLVAWEQAKTPIFTLCRVCEIEDAIGPLGFRKHVDCPPYAEVLAQGRGAAIRHPEYHLGRDLILLYSLYTDLEQILTEKNRLRQPHNDESRQSLARGIIICCYNLLEAFTSGLCERWIYQNPAGPSTVIDKLRNNQGSLKARLLFVIKTFSGIELPGQNDLPFSELFGECKHRRDSLVHCEPGERTTRFGYVKEFNFHDVDSKAVDKTLDLTLQAVALSWSACTFPGRPSWLPQRLDGGRIGPADVRLVPA